MSLQAFKDISSEQGKKNKHELPAEKNKPTIHVVHVDNPDERRLFDKKKFFFPLLPQFEQKINSGLDDRTEGCDTFRSPRQAKSPKILGNQIVPPPTPSAPSHHPPSPHPTSPIAAVLRLAVSFRLRQIRTAAVFVAAEPRRRRAERRSGLKWPTSKEQYVISLLVSVAADKPTSLDLAAAESLGEK